MARLIDADAFMKEIRKWLGNETDFRSLQEIIAGMPTIEAELVKRGKWEEMYFHEGEQGYVRDCSVCQMPQGIGLPDYCPNCGARMTE